MSALFPLTLAGATSTRRGTRLIGPLDLTLEGGGTTAVIGPNGSGKTTFLRLLHGIARLSAGEVRWASDEPRARAFVFQRPVMLRRSVGENLAYPLRLAGAPRAAAKATARDWASRMGLDAMIDRPAPSLSGGEQQKLAIARALITDPALVFLDEPTAALDGRATRDIEGILAEARASGTDLLLATHDMGQARRLADRIVFLKAGRVHETGTAAAFFDGPRTPDARAFLRGDIVE